MNDTGRPIRVPGCEQFFKVLLGDARGPFGVGWRDCLEYLTIAPGTTTFRTTLHATSQLSRAAITPGSYWAHLVFDDAPDVVAPPPVPIDVLPSAP